ncbi:MAG: hypothetical protein V1648_04315 [Candidatus Aenigmatarchaeota archaeon]
MKGQLVFEFIIAGLIFFMILIYTINYLSVNVSDYRSKFYQSRMQSKAIQVSEILMAGQSNLSIADGNGFNKTKIGFFNSTYCGLYNYTKLAKDFYMYENLNYAIVPNDIRIELMIPSSGEIILNCGSANTPRNVTRAEIGRVGIYDGQAAKLSIIVW